MGLTPMQPDIESAITKAANEAGIDPAFALAVAERESDGNPDAKASKSIYGLFQMSGPLRAQYGSFNSNDPYAQAKAWTSFINDTRDDLGKRIGRDPTNEELYLAHYFGTGRAAGMISGQTPGSTNVADVFTPYELSINPHIAKAGSTGNLVGGIESDMRARMDRYGGTGEPTKWAGPDFSSFGVSADGQRGGGTGMYGNVHSAGQPIDFSRFGQAADLKVTPSDAGSERSAGLDQRSSAPAYADQDRTNIPGFPANSSTPMSSVTQAERPGAEIDLSTLGLGAGAPSAQGAAPPA
jgi:hypothetical protein